MGSLISNLLSLAFILATYNSEGRDPDVIVFSFALLAFARYITIEVLLALYHLRLSEKVKLFLQRVSSPPYRGQKTQKITYEPTGKPMGALGYFAFQGILFTMAFFWSAAAARYGPGDSFDRLYQGIKWTAIYMAVYWVQDLWGHHAIVDFKKSRVTNFGYNLFPSLVFMVSILIAFPVLAISEKFNIKSLLTPWGLAGPLLAMKHLGDFYLGYLKARHKPMPDLHISIH